MATITSTGSGLWNSTTPNAPWPSGIVPTNLDTVNIASAHTVTVEGLCEADTLNVKSGGTLTCSTSANSQLWVKRNIVSENGSNTTFDISAAPTVTCHLCVNANGTTNNSYKGWTLHATANATFKGAARTRNTTLLTAVVAGVTTTATVDDATGWRVGDELVFATTQAYNATPRTDEVTITAISGNDITFAVTAYSHAIGGKVGNFTSNLRFEPVIAARSCQLIVEVRYPQSTVAKTVQDVSFYKCGGDGDWARAGFFYYLERSVRSSVKTTLINCSFYKFRQHGVRGYAVSSQPVIQDCCFYTDLQGSAYGTSVAYNSGGLHHGTISGCGFYRNTGAGSWNDEGGCANGQDTGAPINIVDSFASGCARGGWYLQGSYVAVENCESFANYYGLVFREGNSLVTGNEIGTHNGGAAANLYSDLHYSYSRSEVVNTNTQALTLTGLGAQLPIHRVAFVNKDNDTTAQEIYYNAYNVVRDNSNTHRGLSSVKITPRIVEENCEHSLTVLCSPGASITIAGYIQVDATHYNTGNWYPPTVTLSGLGETPQVFTASSSAVGQWEKFLLTITNNGATAGEFTLAYLARAKVGLGNVWFDGVADYPFVGYARHYGYIFDPAVPTRTVNPHITGDETTAASHADIAVDHGGNTITITANHSLAELYDYTQYDLVQPANLQESEHLITSDGILYASTYNIILDGGTITGSGKTLAGDITFAVAGAYSLALQGAAVTFDAAGSYDMTGGSYTGTIGLVNTSGGAVAVSLPYGTSYTNTGPDITVTQSKAVTITAPELIDGTRVQVYNVTDAVELDNSVVSGGSGYSLSYVYTTDKTIRLRACYQSGATAKMPIVATSVIASAGASFLNEQDDDERYIAIGVDGSAVTELSADFANIQIDVDDSDNVFDARRGVAWWRHITQTETGISIYDPQALEYNPDEFNIIVNGALQIENVKATALKITNGVWVRADGGNLIASSSNTIYWVPDNRVYVASAGAVASAVEPLIPNTEITRLMDLAEADEELTQTTATKKHKLTKAVLLEKTVTGAGAMTTITLEEP